MKDKTKVKICGITNVEDYRAAIELGADYAGFIFYRESPRYVAKETAMDIIGYVGGGKHRNVGVFVNESIETVREIYHGVGLDIVQLHGDESPGYVEQLGLPSWKAIRVKDVDSLSVIGHYSCDTFLLDTYVKDKYGGTGRTFAPVLAEAAMETGKRIVVSGGISSDNMEVLLKLKYLPFAVDVNSSLEESPGKKSREKMAAFFEQFRCLRRPCREPNF